MMRRFSRKRRSGNENRTRTINAEEWLPRIVESGVVEAARLEASGQDGVPDTVALIGRGESADGKALIVSFSPRSATDALLGGLAAARQAVIDGGFSGRVFVVAPQWPAGARRVLALVGEAPFAIEAVAAPALSDGRVMVEPEPAAPVLANGTLQLAARMTSSETRSAFTRAAAALEGLAAKHGGAVRVGVDRLELVVLARRVAEIRIAGESAVLETQLGGRSATPLSGADLAGALDGLEGQIRRRLNDRKVREGEEGLRGRVISQLASGTELRGLRAWPMPGRELDDIDGVAVHALGDPVVIAVRERFEWAALAAVLESMAPLKTLFPVLLAGVAPPLRLGSARLLLVAEGFDAGIEQILSTLTLAYELRSVAGASGPALDLVAQSSGEGAEARAARRGRRRGGRTGRDSAAEGSERADEEREDEPAIESVRAEEPEVESEPPPSRPRGPRADESPDSDDASRGRSRRRRRPRRGGRGTAGDTAEPETVAREGGARGQERDETDEKGGSEGGRRRSRRFEEVSLMDLDDGPGQHPGRRPGQDEDESEEGGRAAASRPRRGRRRGRRGGASDEDRPKGGRESAEEGPAEPTQRVEEEDLVDSDDLEEILARLADDVPDFEPTDSTDLSAYDDEEEDEEGEERGDSDSRRLDLEKRRQARRSGSDEDAEEVRPAPRRRSAILVHADRDSILSAMLLARDIRQIEGIWVYPQEELMTFFRSVATDLREDASIFLVGFTPSPARDVIQASSLYRGRLTWFDRHAWPPEDVMALRASLGAEAVHGGEEIDSCLPLVLESCSRRSRFSDKLVDLATGRFTQHDFERWGRLWWWRAGEIARKRGDIRGDIASILTGRPSDLAKEAALVEVPPVPPEVAYVAEHDFRLVHFGGHVMVVVPVDEPFDLQMTARIARERYDATLSLAYRAGGETFVFGGDELNGKRSLDYQAVVEHLVDKLEWVESRPDADHVARFRVRALASHPERTDELIGEIAMGRSLLER